MILDDLSEKWVPEMNVEDNEGMMGLLTEDLSEDEL